MHVAAEFNQIKQNLGCFLEVNNSVMIMFVKCPLFNSKFHARDQTSSQCAFENVADQFQCFCIELNKSDIVFCKLNGSTSQLLNMLFY